ncbi:porin family protein [Acidiluteibacter ferrifornacis]|uniref:Outer membrane protein beta-barrel domain-containing protein n=1 Tax=Acidiluteibacter ferrifornacis TaxID=2692424 RepID=A0A6N9NH05_9FLAO|nr:porin family protein [Acidiluteibacter ferrifornacis]NBG65948.1 hypothetical protein [Acidiluteibacter ferrifornacis]
MKEDNSKIDQLFREGLKKNYPVDSNLWAAVETQLPSSPKRMVPWYFSLNGIALAFVLLMSAMISTDTVRINTVGKSEGVFAKDHTTKQNQTELDEDYSFSQKKTQVEQPQIKTNTTSNSNTKQPSIIDTKNDIVETLEVPDVSTKGIARTNAANASPEPVVPDFKVSAISGNTVTQKFEASVNDIKMEDDLANPSTRESSVKENNTSISFASKNQFSNLSTQQNEIELMVPKLMKWNAVFSNYSLQLNPKRKVVSSIIQPPIQRQKLALEIVAMRSYKSDKILAMSNESLKEYKENSEVAKSNSRMGINLIRPYKFLTFGVGAHYIVQTEQVGYKVNREELGVDISYDTTYRVVNSNFVSNGKPVLLIEKQINEIETPSFTLVEDYLYRTNTFKRLSIPVFIGVQKNYGRIMAELRAGLVANYLFDHQGAYISKDLAITEDFGQSNSIRDLVYGYQFNLSLGYQVNEIVGVGVRCGYEEDLTSFTKQYDSRWRNQNLGLWLLYQPNW